MTDNQPTLFAVYRRAKTSGSTASRAERLLNWNDGSPLRDDVRDQLVAQLQPADNATTTRKVEWLVASLGQQVGKGFVLVGIMRNAMFEGSADVAHLAPSSEVWSQIVLDALRVRLGERNKFRIEVTEHVPVHDGPLEIEIPVDYSRDEMWRVPNHIISGVDKITTVYPDGTRRVVKDRHGCHAA